MKLYHSSTVAMLLLLLPCYSFAEEVDLDVVHRIKQETFYHSKVMDYMSLIADLNGPRMSGSPGYRHAAEKAVKAFKEAGISDAGLEVWNTFGRGWDWSRVAVQMKRPQELETFRFSDEDIADFSHCGSRASRVQFRAGSARK